MRIGTRVSSVCKANTHCRGALSSSGVFLAVMAMITALLVGSASGSGAAPRLAVQPQTSTPTYYLALGDSVPVWDGSHSYPHLLLAKYRQSMPSLQMTNLAVSGATTISMRTGGQYSAALAFLGAHEGHIAFITLDIGGNDVLPCSHDTEFSQCTQVKAMKTNIEAMLTGLHGAAPGIPIFDMTYYDPLLGNWFVGGATRANVLAGVPVLVDLNQTLTALYGAKYTAPVATAFQVTDSTTFEASPWGHAPVDVVKACQWLDIVCHSGRAETFGDDPNVSGQTQIAEAFEHVIGATTP